MKKILFAIACVAAIAVSCNKPENNKQAKLEVPQNKSYHASFTLDDKAFEPAVSDGKVPLTIEITSGGKFLLGFRDTDAIKPESAPLIYKSGEYDVVVTKAPSANLDFTFAMYGHLLIKQEAGNGKWDVEYKNPNGSSYSGAAILTSDKLSGTLADNLCRSWKPKEIILSASGGDMTSAIVGKKFSANVSEIVAYLKEKGIKVDNSYTKYSLESIDYTETGMLIINFKDFAISPFVGNFTLNESKDENIAYNFDLSWEDNPVIPVSGNGTVTVTDTQMTLYTESDVVIKGKTYHISVTIIALEN